MRTDIIYRIDGGRVAVSPDGDNCVFYETFAEANLAHPGLPYTHVSKKHFEDMR